MKIIFVVCIVILVFATFTYDKWSYKGWYDRCIVNSKHPKWTKNCRINFLEEDPQWFVDNGYEKYVR